MRIGVLALQGDFEAHQKMLDTIGVETVQVRKADELKNVDGLVIPGGESTTLLKLIQAFSMTDAICEFHNQGKAIFGTCAGSILMAREIANSQQFRFGFIDITIERNGYGRQLNSFEHDLTIEEIGPEPLHGVFIRAPKITRCGEGVRILAKFEGAAVVASQKRMLVSTFHPELTEDARLHEYFVEKIVARPHA